MNSAATGRRIAGRFVRNHGFSLNELLVAIAIMAVLLTLALVSAQKVRSRMRATQCIANLRQMGVAFRLYAQENMTRLPEPALANKSWEQMISPFYGGSFECPADTELAATVGSSYDWRDTGDPTTTFAGKPLSALGKGDAVLAFEALPGWHASKQVTVVRVDGSTASLDQEECFKQLVRPPDSRAGK